MKRLICVTAAVTALAGLGACDKQDAAPLPSAPKNTAVPEQSPGPVSDARNVAQPSSAPGNPSASDTELSNKVRSVLVTTRDVEIGGVEVAAADGVVTLYGTVGMPAERERAALLALEIDGVRSVVNNLVVVRGS